MSGRGRELTLPAWMTSDKTIENLSTSTTSPQELVRPNSFSQQPTQVSSLKTSFPVFAVQVDSCVQTKQHASTGIIFPVTQTPLQQVSIPFHPSSLSFNSLQSQMTSITKNVLGSTISDPNNDALSWSQHETDDKRKYWYNRLSLMSTFEKPFCLKSPEERSIPPCPWKEYFSDGRQYYSNGTESLWTMPEEFKIWKDKMDLIEKKKSTGMIVVKKSEVSSQNGLKNSQIENCNVRTSNLVLKNTKSHTQPINNVPALTFATAEAARESFKDMLTHFKVSTTAKLKEVQDQCQTDPRWDAVKVQGEKKQCLAEYQTRQLKTEKEQQKVKARKNGDSFLLMLAENTDIDARTRWRDAILILQEDSRFKFVEDSREREDLFKDFILELEKKEREDMKKMRLNATVNFCRILDNMMLEGKISRRSTWNDVRIDLLDSLIKPELKVLDESDLRKCFQDLIWRIDDNFKKSEREKKEEYQRQLEAKQRVFHKTLECMVRDGLITPDTRWKNVLQTSHLTNSVSFIDLRKLSPEVNVVNSEDFSFGRDVFDQVLLKVQETHRADRRLIREMLHNVKVKVSHDSKYEDLKMLVLKIGCLKEVEVDGDFVIKINSVQTEEGEEIEEIEEISTDLLLPSLSINEESVIGQPIRNNSTIPSQLRAMMLDRPASLNHVFSELLDEAAADHAEETRQTRKCEERFIALLRDSFYSSDHVGIVWDDAKKVLQRRSAYDLVSKSDRRRLFACYMNDLSKKMESISKSSKHKSLPSEFNSMVEVKKICETSFDVTPGKRSRSGSNSIGRDEPEKKQRPNSTV